MRIDSVNKAYNSYTTQVNTTTKVAGKTYEKDQVAFSTQAKDFASVKKMIEGTSDVREDRVKEIKDRMNNGTYNVSSEDVAQKMLSLLDIRG